MTLSQLYIHMFQNPDEDLRCSHTSSGIHRRHLSHKAQALPLPRTSLVLTYDKREHDQVEEGHDLGARIDDDVVFGRADAQVRRTCRDYNRVRMCRVDELREESSVIEGPRTKKVTSTYLELHPRLLFPHVCLPVWGMEPSSTAWH